MAHLIPILESKFDVVVVVIATEDRWKLFHEKLSGKSYYESKAMPNPIRIVKALIKRIISTSIIRLFKDNYKETVRIEDILHGRNIPLREIFDVNERSFIEKVRDFNPDLIFSAAYPQIFSKDLVSIPSRGSINFHPSLLPKYRGAHPHFWAIAKGEKTSGLTAHFMTENIDDGNIIAQIEFPIEQYTYSVFYKKIIQETPNLVNLVERYFQEGRTDAKPQDSSQATYFKNDREIHRRIFWNLHTSEEIKDLCRTERAFCFFRSHKVYCMEAYVTNSNRNLTNNVRVENGTIIDIYEDAIVVKAIDGCVNIKEFEENGKRLYFKKWAEKYNINIGEKFE